MGKRVSAVAPQKADALQRKRARRESAQVSARLRAEHPTDDVLTHKRREIDVALKRAREARSDVPPGRYVLEYPLAIEVLFGARDATKRRMFHFAALALLASYSRDSEAPTSTGWRRVPTTKTQRERAAELGMSEDYLRKLNRELRAVGAIADGGLHDAGDGKRTYTVKRGGQRVRRIITLKRRVWRLAPASAILVPDSSERKADNLFAPDLISTQAPVADPVAVAFSCLPSSESASHFSNRSIDQDEHAISDHALSVFPVSVLEEAPLEILTAPREPERPEAAKIVVEDAVHQPPSLTLLAYNTDEKSKRVDVFKSWPTSPRRRLEANQARSSAHAKWYPSRDENHASTCVCCRCWIAASTRNGTLPRMPHPPGCKCPVCGAWRGHALLQWKRFRDPSETTQTKTANKEEENHDPTLMILRRLRQAVSTGQVTLAEHERLASLLIEGFESEVAAALEEHT